MNKAADMDECRESENLLEKSQVRISKSQYIKGMQCSKALWLYRRRPDLAAPVTEAQQKLFDSGHTVERLAWECFPERALPEDTLKRRSMSDEEKRVPQFSLIWEHPLWTMTAGKLMSANWRSLR